MNTKRETRHYVKRMTLFIRTPLQRLRNMKIAVAAARDCANQRTSADTALEVVRKVKIVDNFGAQRGIEDPFVIAAGRVIPL